MDDTVNKAERLRKLGRQLKAEIGDHLDDKVEPSDQQRRRWGDQLEQMADLKNEVDGDARMRAQVDALGRGIGTPDAWPPMPGHAGSPSVKTWTEQAAKSLLNMAQRPDGSKALVSGSWELPALLPGITTEAQVPTTLLGLLATEQLSRNEYSYLVQVARDNNAAPVADGEDKPVSQYTFEQREGRCSTLAHLTEPVPQRYFADVASLQQVLADELAYGLRVTLERQVLSGTGEGEDFPGVLTATSGTQVQPFTLDAATSLRAALTLARTVGEQPTAIVVSPTDGQALALARDDSGGPNTGGYLLVPLQATLGR